MEYSVSLEKIIKEFHMEEIFMPVNPAELLIKSADINRPGLQLCEFYEYFDENRIQIIGLSETAFLEQYEPEDRQRRVDVFFAHKPCLTIFTRNIDVPDEILNSAKTYDVPILRTSETTSVFMASLISYLNVQLAPRITRHGVLVEVYGEGLLMLGESGVGKSETAVELIKRGHRLIADDAVEIKRVSSKTLVGTAPDNIRHFIELRGIGIINARRIFGMGSVKLTEKIDMALFLEQWDPDKIYDRIGMENETTEILGIEVPSVTIPVKPGRNLASIIEVAAMNNRQKKMGYFAAQELLHNLGMTEDAPATEEQKSDWKAY